MFRSGVQGLVELLGEGSENEAELVEPEPVRLSGIVVDQVKNLVSSSFSVLANVLRSHVAVIPVVNYLEEVDQVKIVEFGKVFPEFLKLIFLSHNFRQDRQHELSVDSFHLPEHSGAI